MSIHQKSLKILEKCALCDHCLGRQFALLGHGVENDQRGRAIKLFLTINAHASALEGDKMALKILETLAKNGFFQPGEETLQRLGERIAPKHRKKRCFLCEDKFETCEDLAEKAVNLLDDYEYTNFLVGIEVPITVAEREDELRATFKVGHGESIRNEFGRILGKEIAKHAQKIAEFRKPDIVVLANPFTAQITLQVNPLFISGRYRKIARGMPQSKWHCSHCRGRGCEKCNWTGKMYAESVHEIIEKPVIDATQGVKSSFHASGREDIDARMLGNGRPFVVEVSKPRRRFLNLEQLQKDVNAHGKGKVEVSDLRFTDKESVRKLKKAESSQKEYRVLVQFENEVRDEDLLQLEGKMENMLVRQQTPLRVLHRRADLTREKYIYKVNVKKLSPRSADMKVRCQGGLYVKELVTGDGGRTVPSVSEILKNKAKPMKLDVLNVIMEDREKQE